ncbi:hypothetical protein [Streptomyces sp. NPDC014894]|uniref:hypothetical protein n=1 Tax=Streptomyces sp. NPDC014894 TaxID=3364931 RepID=UPI0036F54DDD
MNDQDYGSVGSDQILSVEEGTQLKSRLSAQRAGETWRWMGNYGSPQEAAQVANNPPACLAGAVVFGVNGNLTPAWMFF